MNVAQDYASLMASSTGWIGILTSPIAALSVAKLATLLWTLLSHG
ncbi:MULTISPECIES: hypothetical protein [unclassified Massilia]|nr:MULTISPECIES: hypothetical protein [unclassified Massilia]